MVKNKIDIRSRRIRIRRYFKKCKKWREIDYVFIIINYNKNK